MNNNNTNSILVFEYYTASGTHDQTIVSEAVSLINSLLNDLSSFSNHEDVDIHFLISDKFENIGNEFGSMAKNNIINRNNNNKSDVANRNNPMNMNNVINKIVIDTSLENWLNENISEFDSCIFISAEENMNLYNLTKIIENNEVKIYGSDSESTLLCSNKFSTFKHLQHTVNQPRTFYFIISDETPWEDSIKNILEFVDNGNNKNNKHADNDYKLIIKTVYGVDCQDMVIISNIEDIKKIKKEFPDGSKVIVQEFIPGENVSVSLISDGKNAIPISLNKQYIDINKENQEYIGGELPYNHPLTKNIFSIAKKVAESVEGIKGFIGVDLIISNWNNNNSIDIGENSKDISEKFSNNIYFLEINSRFTTPYVGLSKIANFNIGETIIELLDNKITMDSLYEKNIGSNKYDNVVKFKKNGNDLDIEIVHEY